MKKLIVCGDSFMSATQDIPDRIDCLGGGHFTQIFAKELGFKYDTFARGGASNFLIYLQVKEALNNDPDYIIVGFTDSLRVEILNGQHHDGDEIGKEVTVYDFNYHEYPDLSTELRYDKWSDKPRYISTSVVNVIDWPDKFEDKGRLFNEYYYNVYKDYFTSFWSPAIQSMYDKMIIEKTIDLLDNSGVPFHITGNSDYGNNSNDLRSIEDMNPYTGHGDIFAGPYRFHTTAERQKDLADKWIKYYKNYGG